MADCLFCQMVKGNIPTTKIYEDDHIFVIKDIHPKAKVHLLIISKRHIENLNAVQEGDSALLGYMMTSLKNFAKEQGLAAFRTIINTGSDAGQQIFHLHLHLLGGGPIASF